MGCSKSKQAKQVQEPVPPAAKEEEPNLLETAKDMAEDAKEVVEQVVEDIKDKVAETLPESVKEKETGVVEDETAASKNACCGC